MKRILSLILITCFVAFFLASQGWAINKVVAIDVAGTSTKHKSGNLSNCADETGWTTGSNINTACVQAGASSTVYVCAGSYSGTMLNSSGAIALGGASQNLVGAGKLLTFIDGAGINAYTIDYNGRANAIVSDLTVGGAPSDYANIKNTGGTNTQLNDVNIDGGNKAIALGNAATMTTNRVTIKNTTGTPRTVSVEGTGVTLTMNYSPLIDNVSGVGSTKDNTTVVTLNNSSIINTQYEAIITTGAYTSTMNLNNMILVGNAWNASGTLAISRGNAANIINVNNSIILPNPRNGDDYTWSAVTESNNLYVSPKFVSHKYESSPVISFMVDDHYSLSDFVAAGGPKDLLEAKGWRGTIAIDVMAATTGNSWATLAGLINSGHDVALHTESHAQLDQTNAMVVQYVGEGTTATTTVNADGTALTTTIDGGGDLNLDLTNASYKRVAQLCTHIDGLANYTCAVSSALNQNTLSTSLKTITAQNIKTAYTYALDATASTDRYYVNEITTGKSLLETGVRNAAGVGTPAASYTCRVFVHPGDAHSANSRAAILAAGLIGARGSITSGNYIYNMNVFDVRSTQASSSFGRLDLGDTSAEITRNVTAYTEWLKAGGRVGVIYGHRTSVGETNYDFSPTDWGILLDAVSASNISVMTFGDMIERLKTLSDHTNDNYTYYRCATETSFCMTDESDYNLKAGSPAINSGTDVGLTTDFAGKPVRGTPDIGAYEFQSVGGGLLMLLNMGR
jgi:hypothetical protein